MMAKPTAFLLADLGVTKSHSRPHTSNDNPFSEAHFKTLKYQPQFPKRFGCIEDARTFCRRFFIWYNQDHHHVGIGLMTPDQVHFGQADVVHAARQNVLTQAYQANPERFVSNAPKPPAKPTATWINPPPPKPRLLMDATTGAAAEVRPVVTPLSAVSPEIADARWHRKPLSLNKNKLKLH
jgi:putative transposase